MPIRQLQDDVNLIEEAELRWLEGAATVGNGAHDEAPMEVNIAPAEVVEQTHWQVHRLLLSISFWT